ncbi:response regulator transcription factor [bacterium]|nr:response regulator transcription factor [bacterium]
MKQILVIEDDPAIQKGLRISLEEEHYRVLTVSDGTEGLQTAMNQSFDLILLDLMLPGKNGQEICREIRENGNHTPVIMLTSRKEESDKVLGLELGADDYITKPFSVRELMARIKALLRRTSPKDPVGESVSFGSVTLNFKKQEAVKSGHPIKLTVREFKILKFFIAHEQEVISRDQLLDEVWGYDTFPTTRTIDTFVLNLRKKIEEDPSHPAHLITIHGAGYKFLK